ncbi:MAG: hypothetical protein AAFP18_03645 [Bacteroidota bacterium]
MPEARTTTLASQDGVLTIAMKPQVERSVRRVEGLHQQFIADHWPSLAAAAFDGWKRHGAGAVVLIGSAKSSFFGRSEPFVAETIWYTTQVHNVPGAPEEWFSGWEADQLETYDPDTESLLIFVDVESDLRCGYRVEGMLAPPEAHVHARARFN